MTDRRPRLAPAVALLVITAGCAGVLPADPDSDATRLTADTVTDTSALIRAHTETLRTNSFTVHATTTTRDANDTFRIRTERTWRVDPGPPIRAWTTTRSTVEGDAPARYERAPERVSAWRRGNTTTVHVRADDGTRTRTADLLNTSVRLNRALHRQLLLRIGDRQNATVDRVAQNGTRLYRIRADLNDTRVTSNGSMTLVVDPDGYVRRIETTRTVEYRSGSRVVTRTVRFSRVGATTIESPDWARQ